MKYIIVENDGFIRNAIDTKNKPNKYGTPKLFTYEEAERWIERRTYKGMSVHYTIEPAERR